MTTLTSRLKSKIREKVDTPTPESEPEIEISSAPGMHISPQPGPQTQFHKSKADIVVYGGAAGGGKTWSLLAEPLRHVNNPKFGAVIFRRTSKQVKSEGGLWDEAYQMYHRMGATFKESTSTVEFPSGAKVTFAHLQHEKNKFDWQGAQIALVEFDELTHFSKGQMFYLLSRMRSMSGVNPYMRASTNPDATSWVKDFLWPWVHAQKREEEAKQAEEEGRLCLNAESAEIRYMERMGDIIVWHHPSTLEEEDRERMMSVTFIKSTLKDNQILMRTDPEYERKLKNMSLVERKRLLEGDWEVTDKGDYFDSEWFEIAPDTEIPWARLRNFVRYWDFASTDRRKDKSGRACFTSGVLMAEDPMTRKVYILDVKREKYAPSKVKELVIAAAHLDNEIYEAQGGVFTMAENEPGSSGDFVISDYAAELRGYKFEGDKPSGEKTKRSEPFATYAKNGLCVIRKANWNSAFLAEAASYPNGFKDQIDGATGAFAKINRPTFIMV